MRAYTFVVTANVYFHRLFAGFAKLSSWRYGILEFEVLDPVNLKCLNILINIISWNIDSTPLMTCI